MSTRRSILVAAGSVAAMFWVASAAAADAPGSTAGDAAEIPTAVGITVAATAAHADPTGIASRAVGQAEMAHQEEVAQRSLVEDEPLYDKLSAKTGAVVAEGQQLQSDARLQRLMQLVQEKHCDRQ